VRFSGLALRVPINAGQSLTQLVAQLKPKIEGGNVNQHSFPARSFQSIGKQIELEVRIFPKLALNLLELRLSIYQRRPHINSMAMFPPGNTADGIKFR
jgi:hypothetical protein